MKDALEQGSELCVCRQLDSTNNKSTDFFLLLTQKIISPICKHMVLMVEACL